MTHRFLRRAGQAGGALALFILASCVLDGDKVSKRGSEVENEVYGVLVAENGDPAAGALVKALPARAVLPKVAAGDSDSVVTDGDGRYVFRGLPAGDYNLLGSYRSGSLVVLIPGVDHRDTAGPLDLGTDTLRAPGGIRSRILLGGAGRVGVLCYVPGTSNLAVSDDSGWCLLDKVPQGRYSVRYSVSGFVLPPDTGVAVLSGRITELGSRELAYDPELPPPAPVGLKASFDPFAQRVTLTWSPVGVADLDGYVVYRDSPEAVEPQAVPGGLVRDTVFTDAVAGIGAEETRRLTYRLRSRDREANLSLFSRSATVEAYPVRRLTTQLAWAHSAQSADTGIAGDTLTLVVAYANPTLRVRTIEWRRPVDGTTLRIRRDSAFSGSDTLRWRPESEGTTTLRVEAVDEGSRSWTLDRRLIILSGGLRPLAGADTTVSIGDSVMLWARVIGRSSRVGRWEWDAGMRGRFAEAGEGAFGIRVPDTAGDYPCVLRLTGRDGSAALDTMLVRVVQDPPVADAGPDRRFDARDTVRISGAGSDAFGRIVAWEWKRDGDSAFSPGALLVHPLAGASDSLVRFILRVTDDDGNADTDTTVARIRFPPFQAEAGLPRTVTIKDSVVLTAEGQGGMHGIARWEWDIGGTGRFREAAAGAFPIQVPDTAVRLLCVLRITDTRGDFRLDTAVVDVLLDPPSVTLSSLASHATPFDTVKLSAQGRDGRGKVVAYAWDMGGTGTFVAGRPDTLLRLPWVPLDSLFPMVVRVEDDDGLIALDTNFIRIMIDKPRAVLYADSWAATFSGDSVLLHGRESSDGFGRIRKWEWSVNGADYREAGPETTIVLPVDAADMGAFSMRMRVTDDDGLTDSAEYGVFVRERGGKHWYQIGQHPELFSRRDAAVAAFNGSLWMTGGHTRGSENADVWRMGGVSDSWDRMAVDRAFPPRSMHRMLVHAGRMWVLGGSSGLSDVWSTADGASWTRATDSAAFGPRAAFAAYVFQGRMWVVGGGSDAGGTRYRNDVWSSVDGVAWTLETANAAFTPRRHAGYFQLGGKLWLTGGETGGAGQSEIWNSADGRSWSRVGDLAGLVDSLAGHSHLVHDGYVWMFRGADAGEPSQLRSPDGVNWAPVVSEPPFQSRSHHASLVYKSHLFVIGGTEPPGGPDPYGAVYYSR